MDMLIEIVLIFVAAAIAFAAGYLIQKRFTSAEIKAQAAEIRLENGDDVVVPLVNLDVLV